MTQTDMHIVALDDEAQELALEAEQASFRRELVPSERELASGRTLASDPDAVPFVTNKQRRGPSRETVRAALLDFAPRRIAAGHSAFPLVLFAAIGLLEAIDGAVFQVI